MSVKRFRALLQNTWWLWLLFAAVGVGLGVFAGKIGLVLIPICVFTFFWFAYLRYDDSGNPRGGE